MQNILEKKISTKYSSEWFSLQLLLFFSGTNSPKKEELKVSESFLNFIFLTFRLSSLGSEPLFSLFSMFVTHTFFFPVPIRKVCDGSGSRILQLSCTLSLSLSLIGWAAEKNACSRPISCREGESHWNIWKSHASIFFGGGE